MSLTPINARNLPVQPAGSVSRTLGASDFLRLMTKQLEQQDPFKPVDNQAMIAQMAQVSASAGISDMGKTLKGISDQLTAQTELLVTVRDALINGAKP